MFFFQNQSVRRRKINYKRLKKDQEVEAEQRETETVQDQESDSEAEEENNLMEELFHMKLAVVGGMKGTYLEDYLSEEMNWMKVCEFTREE